MTIIHFPRPEQAWPVELYRAELPDVFHAATDTLGPLPVRAVIPELDDGSVEVGPYRLKPEVALALAEALKVAARYATPVSSGPDFELIYQACSDPAQ